jgi:hypothetical protein
MIDSLRFGSFLGCICVAAWFSSPTIAHTTQVAGDVAGTWHIEPNHNPKAGEPATAWIALTREGGQLLPLESANCQLAVYAQPRQPIDAPVLEPTLAAITAEQYQGIPGAKIIFPQTGIYELELSCTPKTAGNFQPFDMRYEVTVAEGTAPPAANSTASSEIAASPETAEPPQQTATRSILLLTVGFIALSLILGLAAWLQFSKRLKR